MEKWELEEKIEMARRFDPGKNVGTCDGNFSPDNKEPHHALHLNKTYQDSLPKEDRPRYQEWIKRQEAKE